MGPGSIKKGNGFQALQPFVHQRLMLSCLGAPRPRRVCREAGERGCRQRVARVRSKGCKKKTTTQQKLGVASRRSVFRVFLARLFFKPYLEILDAHAARALVVPEAFRVEPVDLDSLH